jgi:hypothetical protein
MAGTLDRRPGKDWGDIEALRTGACQPQRLVVRWNNKTPAQVVEEMGRALNGLTVWKMFAAHPARNTTLSGVR